MGCSQSWLAVKGKSPQAVLEELRLRLDPAGQHKGLAPHGGQLSTGWYVVLSGVFGLQTLSDEVVQRLSVGCEVVRGSIEDNEMVSVAEGWKNGQRLWSVTHDPSQGDEHLGVEGELPSIFASIRDRLLAEQRSETDPVDHVFDIPVQLAKSLTGYHPDETIPGARFERLAERSWLKRFFA
jgi:hypothetical protein